LSRPGETAVVGVLVAGVFVTLMVECERAKKAPANLCVCAGSGRRTWNLFSAAGFPGSADEARMRRATRYARSRVGRVSCRFGHRSMRFGGGLAGESGCAWLTLEQLCFFGRGADGDAAVAASACTGALRRRCSCALLRGFHPRWPYVEAMVGGAGSITDPGQRPRCWRVSAQEGQRPRETWRRPPGSQFPGSASSTGIPSSCSSLIAGLTENQEPRALPGSWLGASAGQPRDSQPTIPAVLGGHGRITEGHPGRQETLRLAGKMSEGKRRRRPDSNR